MPLELILFFVALVPVLWRGWLGWKMGATSELRFLIVALFGLLVALRYWYQTTAALTHLLPVDPQYLAAGVCIVLFLAAAALAGLVVNLKGEVYQSVQANYLDSGLGVLSGLFGGGLIAASILLAASVALPGKVEGFDVKKYPMALHEYPAALFRELEKNVANIEQASTARTPLPSLELSESDPEQRSRVILWK